MHIHGGCGYIKELPIERYYRDSILLQVGEGANDIQRLVIARAGWKNTRQLLKNQHDTCLKIYLNLSKNIVNLSNFSLFFIYSESP